MKSWVLAKCVWFKADQIRILLHSPDTLFENVLVFPPSIRVGSFLLAGLDMFGKGFSGRDD